MTATRLNDLQASIRDKSAFNQLDDYNTPGQNFLSLLGQQHLTRIVSPTRSNYIFFQYGEDYRHRITRPLNTELFIESPADFKRSFERLMMFLEDLHRHQSNAINLRSRRKYSETKFIQPSEIVGSVKTTSKDRIDKVFLDKHLLTKLLGRPIPVAAIFLHDVQRASRGESIFGVNSTFKRNHFLGYAIALNRLDGVYYIDPLPEMLSDSRLRQQIFDFQQFLTHDLWSLSGD